jgi:hypothetical protein
MNKIHFALVLSLCLAGCGKSEAALSKPNVPAKLEVPAGNKLAFELQGIGAQLYTCQPKKDDATQFEWTLKAPDARLTDAAGHEAGRHYKGPTWESTDGSKVVGKLEQKADAPGANDIPWLLVSAKSNEGKGKFGNVTFIQRIGTQGGKAPTTDCDAAHVGKEVRVDYKAKYCFYVAGS